MILDKIISNMSDRYVFWRMRPVRNELSIILKYDETNWQGKKSVLFRGNLNLQGI